MCCGMLWLLVGSQPTRSANGSGGFHGSCVGRVVRGEEMVQSMVERGLPRRGKERVWLTAF